MNLLSYLARRPHSCSAAFGPEVDPPSPPRPPSDPPGRPGPRDPVPEAPVEDPPREVPPPPGPDVPRTPPEVDASAGSGVALGVFDRASAADEAVYELVHQGVEPARIDVIAADPELALRSGVRVVSGPLARRRGLATFIGATLGAMAGYVLSIALLATGGVPWTSFGLAFVVLLLGAIVGGYLGIMSSRGLEPDAADVFDLSLRRNSILVAVRAREKETAELEARLASLGAWTLSMAS